MNGSFGGGTGTETDPYLVEDIEDLRNLSTIGTGYAKLMVDIDINDTKYADTADGWTPIQSKGFHLDGNGKTIKNIIVSTYGFTYAGGATYTSYLNNITFENIVIKSGATFIHGASGGGIGSCSHYWEVFNSKFSVFLERNSGRVIDNAKNIQYSTFAVSGTASFAGGLIFQNVYQGLFETFNTSYLIQYCNFYFDDLKIYPTSSATSFALISTYATIKNCAIRGKIIFLKNNLNLHIKNLNYSYFALQTEGQQAYISPTNINSEVAFYDKDLLGDNITIVTDGAAPVYALTTEQCKSADYLNSIGFLCKEV